MRSFEAKYETPPQVPPPYCYYYHLKGRVVNNTLQVTFDWVYHHREELTEEEITSEGFTGADDYHWQGNLDAVWIDQIEKMIRSTRKASRSSEEIPYLHLTIKDEKEKIFEGEPAHFADWEYFLQEVIQAIYETASKEAPLQLRCKKVSEDKDSTNFNLEVHFKDRTVKMLVQKDNSKSESLPISWESVQSVLQSVYALDYDPEAATEKEPQQTGFYIYIDEEGWYELGGSAQNPSRQKDHIGAIIRFFEKLQSASTK